MPIGSLLRHPYRYLVAHWTVTGALAAALLVPHATSGVPPRHAQERTITLLTGQVVRLNADGTPRPAPDLLEGHLFGADEYATPRNVYDITSDAYAGLPPWARTGPPTWSAYFSPQLFDISYLETHSYDNASADRIPVIVRFNRRQDARRAVARGAEDGIRFTHAFEYVPDAVGYVAKHGPFVSPTPDYKDGMVSIYLDAREQIAPPDSASTAAGVTSAEPIGPSLAESLPLIGADVARKHGLTGKGIKIAIVDTGIDGKHTDLAGRIVAARDFSTDGTTDDLIGHGTHVAGIAAGTGAASDGKYGGVAPAAELINAKALNKNGSGTMDGVMQAMEWAADQGARIENLSLGSGPTDGTDPVSQLVNAITARKNVLFVIAAGNSGARGTVSSPAAADAALTVGAIDKQRVLAPFSSRGPRVGDMAVKPDIVAPGVRITAPRANHGNNDPYATYSGTSMAAPMVSGAAALAMQLHPDWPALTVKDALMNSAAPLGDDEQYLSVYDQGAGVVNLANLINLKVLIQPANISFGIIDEDRPGVRAVQIRNLTGHPYTMDLAWRMRVIQGSGTFGGRIQPAPHFTLPPEGALKLTLIVNGGGSGEPQTVSSEILATRDGESLARAIAGFTMREGGG